MGDSPFLSGFLDQTRTELKIKTIQPNKHYQIFSIFTRPRTTPIALPWIHFSFSFFLRPQRTSR